MSIICTCGKASGPMCNGASGCPLNGMDGVPAPKRKTWKERLAEELARQQGKPVVASVTDEIRDLLINAGFTQSDDPNDYYNDYICICLQYEDSTETRIVNNNGDTLVCLPTNYWALLGWLLKKRFISFIFIDALK